MIELDGELPINPSGGLIGVGHPVGGTGVRQVLDAYRQVTDTDRQFWAFQKPVRPALPRVQQTERVRNPIGLDLGGETAADIALSIVSEVVAIMHGRSGSPLSAKSSESVLQPT